MIIAWASRIATLPRGEQRSLQRISSMSTT
jgi:hypothetical protein